METILYMVSSGSDSSFGVEAIFSSIELAEEYMLKFKSDSYEGYNDIIEYQLDPFQKQFKEGLIFYHVSMDILGNSDVKGFINPNHWAITENPSFIGPRDREKAIMHHYLWAKDENNAMKIVNEIRLHKIASDDWGINE